MSRRDARSGGAGQDSPDAKETCSIDYGVTIAKPGATQASVRWELAGIEEVKQFRLRFFGHRASNIEGSGQLEWQNGELYWTPNAPYAHLSYVVDLKHAR